MNPIDPDTEIYPIGVVSKLTGLPQRYLRALEQRGVLKPGRSEKNRRLYSENEIKKLQHIYYLGVLKKINIAGIKEILAILGALPASEREGILRMFESGVAQSGGLRMEKADASLPSSLEEQQGMVGEIVKTPELEESPLDSLSSPRE